MVMNIGDEDIGGGDERGVSIALTRNYVSASNLSDVLRFLDSRVSQISGCRDRGEAIQPDDLGREFRKALSQMDDCKTEIGSEEKKDDVGTMKGRWADLLEKAELRAKEGWGCDAWVDLPSTCPSSEVADTRDKESGGEHSSTKTSVLARAKASSSSAATTSTTSSGGFSFSFL